MKLAFSTAGCPNMDWNNTCKMARELGYAGFEVRDLGPETLQYGPFYAARIEQTKSELAKMGIEITCFSIGKSTHIGKTKNGARSKDTLRMSTLAKEVREEARQYIKLASNIGCRYVRLQIDDYVTPDIDDTDVLAALEELAPFAELSNVTLLVETKGIYGDTERLRNLLARFRSDAVGAMWDVDHTCHAAAETPEQTVKNLGRMIKYVHMRDSVKSGDEADYKIGGKAYRDMGEGDLPVGGIMRALRSIDFNGFISYEWRGKVADGKIDNNIPRFNKFMQYMQSNFRKYLDGTSLLYDNIRGDGKYFWQKETLLDYTFPQVLDRVCEKFPDQLAFNYTTLEQTSKTYFRRDEGYIRTYAQFRDDADTFARSLIALGVRKGDKVAIWSPNLPEWFITFWAAVKIGAVLVTVNTAYKIYEAEYLLKQSDAHTLVMGDGVKDSDYVAIIGELCPELKTMEKGDTLFSERLPMLRNVITIESKRQGCWTWNDAIEKSNEVPAERIYELSSQLHKDDVCNMQYTSGTTGFPKGVMLTHYNIVNNGKAIGDCMDLSTADRMMIQVPMFHCFGMVLAMTASITHGAAMSPIPVFSPRLGLECINKAKITAFHGVPTMFIAMLEHEDFSKTDFSYMRTGIMAGSPCPVEKMKEVIEKMNMTEICITYGQTEASPAVSMSKTTDSVEQRVNTVGGEIFGVECKIFSPERNPVTGKYDELGDDEDGEFVARGYNIMKGYYKMPEATEAAIDEDGWLHTGDMARRRHEDGYFKITGRIKDMIIRGGENIYPKEIEDFIYTHEKISDVQVIGVPDKDYGEEIMACIIIKTGETLTEDDVKEYVRTHMAKHKTPRYVRFVDAFPMNAAGKIMKYKMRSDAVEYLGLQDASKIVTA